MSRVWQWFLEGRQIAGDALTNCSPRINQGSNRTNRQSVEEAIWVGTFFQRKAHKSWLELKWLLRRLKSWEVLAVLCKRQTYANLGWNLLAPLALIENPFIFFTNLPQHLGYVSESYRCKWFIFLITDGIMSETADLLEALAKLVG